MLVRCSLRMPLLGQRVCRMSWRRCANQMKKLYKWLRIVTSWLNVKPMRQKQRLLSILGGEYALTAGVAGSFGFDAITVALLGRAKPVGTVFAAFLFAMLRAGSRTMQARTQTPIDIVLVIQALIILFIAAPALVRAIFRIKTVKEVETIQAKGWNG